MTGVPQAMLKPVVSLGGGVGFTERRTGLTALSLLNECKAAASAGHTYS